ncbi:MAG TPA: biotin/lipoyl-containing protein [Polyangia bacterium]
MRRYAVTLGPGSQSVEVDIEDVDFAPGGGSGGKQVRVVVAGEARTITIGNAGPQRYTWLDGSRVVTTTVESAPGPATSEGEGAPRKLSVAVRGDLFVATVTDAQVAEIPVVSAPGQSGGPVILRAPMPGRVIKHLAKAGDTVKAGAGLIVVEAMKMENELRAPRDGKVGEFRASEGAAVEAGQELVVVE